MNLNNDITPFPYCLSVAFSHKTSSYVCTEVLETKRKKKKKKKSAYLFSAHHTMSTNRYDNDDSKPAKTVNESGTEKYNIVYESMILKYVGSEAQGDIELDQPTPHWVSMYGVLVDLGNTAEMRLFHNVQESVSDQVAFSATETIAIHNLRKISASVETFYSIQFPNNEPIDRCFFVRYVDPFKNKKEVCFKALKIDATVKWMRALKLLAKRLSTRSNSKPNLPSQKKDNMPPEPEMHRAKIVASQPKKYSKNHEKEKYQHQIKNRSQKYDHRDRSRNGQSSHTGSHRRRKQGGEPKRHKNAKSALNDKLFYKAQDIENNQNSINKPFIIHNDTDTSNNVERHKNWKEEKYEMDESKFSNEHVHSTVAMFKSSQLTRSEIREALLKYKKFLKSEDGQRVVLLCAVQLAKEDLIRNQIDPEADGAQLTKEHIVNAHRYLMSKAKADLTVRAGNIRSKRERTKHARKKRRRKSRSGKNSNYRLIQHVRLRYDGTRHDRGPKKRPSNIKIRSHRQSRRNYQSARKSKIGSNGSGSSGSDDYGNDLTYLAAKDFKRTSLTATNVEQAWWKYPNPEDVQTINEFSREDDKRSRIRRPMEIRVPLTYIEKLTSPAVSESVKRRVGQTLRRHAGIDDVAINPRYIEGGPSTVSDPPSKKTLVQIRKEALMGTNTRELKAEVYKNVALREKMIKRNTCLSYIVDNEELSQAVTPLNIGFHVVPTYNDVYFAAIRNAFGVDHDFLAGTRFNLEVFLDDNAPDVAWSSNRKFVVKCLSSADHDQLVSAASLLPSLFEDGANSTTLVVPIFAHFRVQRGESEGPDDIVAIATGRCLPSAAPDFMWDHNLFQIDPSGPGNAVANASTGAVRLGVHAGIIGKPTAAHIHTKTDKQIKGKNVRSTRSSAHITEKQSEVIGQREDDTFSEPICLRRNPAERVFKVTLKQLQQMEAQLREDTTSLDQMGFSEYSLVAGFYEVMSEKMLAAKGGRFPRGTIMSSSMPLVCRWRAGNKPVIRAYYFAIALFVQPTDNSAVPRLTIESVDSFDKKKQNANPLFSKKTTTKSKDSKKEVHEKYSSYGKKFLQKIMFKMSGVAAFQPHPLSLKFRGELVTSPHSSESTAGIAVNNNVLSRVKSPLSFRASTLVTSTRSGDMQNDINDNKRKSNKKSDVIHSITSSTSEPDIKTHFRSALWYYNSSLANMKDHWAQLFLQDLGINSIYRTQVVHCHNSRVARGPSGNLLSTGDILAQVEGHSLHGKHIDEVHQILERVLKTPKRSQHYKPIELRIIPSKLTIGSTSPNKVMQSHFEVDEAQVAPDMETAQAIVAAAQTLTNDFKTGLQLPEDLVAFAVGYAERAGLMQTRGPSAASPRRIAHAAIQHDTNLAQNKVALIAAALQIANEDAVASSPRGAAQTKPSIQPNRQDNENIPLNLPAGTKSTVNTGDLVDLKQLRVHASSSPHFPGDVRASRNDVAQVQGITVPNKEVVGGFSPQSLALPNKFQKKNSFMNPAASPQMARAVEAAEKLRQQHELEKQQEQLEQVLPEEKQTVMNQLTNKKMPNNARKVQPPQQRRSLHLRAVLARANANSRTTAFPDNNIGTDQKIRLDTIGDKDNEKNVTNLKSAYTGVSNDKNHDAGATEDDATAGLTFDEMRSIPMLRTPVPPRRGSNDNNGNDSEIRTMRKSIRLDTSSASAPSAPRFNSTDGLTTSDIDSPVSNTGKSSIMKEDRIDSPSSTEHKTFNTSSPYDNGVLTLSSKPAANTILNTKSNNRTNETLFTDEQNKVHEEILNVGDSVFGLLNNKTRWYAGHVKDIDPSTTTVSLEYDDGYVEHDIPLHRIRLKRRYQKGDRVTAQYNRAATWYEGKVTHIIPGKGGDAPELYNILYDDGDDDEGLDPCFVRLVNEKPPRLGEENSKRRLEGSEKFSKSNLHENDTEQTDVSAIHSNNDQKINTTPSIQQGTKKIKEKMTTSRRVNEKEVEKDSSDFDSMSEKEDTEVELVKNMAQHKEIKKNESEQIDTKISKSENFQPPIEKEDKNSSGKTNSANIEESRVDEQLEASQTKSTKNEKNDKKKEKNPSVAKFFKNLFAPKKKKKEADNVNINEDKQGSDKNPDDKSIAKPVKYKVGDKVFALFKQGLIYHPCKVKRVIKKAKTRFYDLKYDDGDKESQIPPEQIRRRETYKIDQQVLVQPKKQTSWKIAKISKPGDTIDAECLVELKNGELISLPPSRIVSHDTLPIGDDTHPVLNLEENDGNKKSIIPKEKKKKSSKKIETRNESLSENVDDEEKAHDMQTASIPVESSKEASFSAGDRVLALFENGDKWYKGKIDVVDTSVHPAVYNITYDDGDKEQGITQELIRHVVQFKKGDRVEAQYDGGVVWYPGQIIGLSDTYDDSYSVLYDDGDREDDLDHVLMRPCPFLPTGTRVDKAAIAQKYNASSNKDGKKDKENETESDDDWSEPLKLKAEHLSKVKKSVTTAMEHLDNEGKDISVKTVRIMVEKQLNRDFNSGIWKKWFKKAAQAVMDSWEMEDRSGASGSPSGSSSSDTEDADHSPRKQKKNKEKDNHGKTEYDTPVTTSETNTSKIVTETQMVMERMDDNGEALKVSVIQHAVSIALGERKLDSPHWTNFFKKTAKSILDKWEEEESNSDEDRSNKDKQNEKNDLTEHTFPEVAVFDKMTPELFLQLRKIVRDVLTKMDEKGEKLSLKVMRQRVSEELNADFDGAEWKNWFKDEAQVVIDSWDEESGDSNSHVDENVNMGNETKAVFKTLDDLTDNQIADIEDEVEDILERLDNANEQLSAAAVRKEIEKKHNWQLQGQEWKIWFKDLCQEILDQWDAEDDDNAM